MATTYLPRIAAADHEALRHVVENYPAESYEKWLNLQEKEIANWKRSGWDVILIDVSADDFIRYCPGDRGKPQLPHVQGYRLCKSNR